MPATFVDVSTYLVFAYSGADGYANTRAIISLGIPNGLAYLAFYTEGATIPANSKTIQTSGKPIFHVNYPYYQYAGVIDLLRNEKPIKFLFRDDMFSYITTSDEPVGEEE